MQKNPGIIDKFMSRYNAYLERQGKPAVNIAQKVDMPEPITEATDVETVTQPSDEVARLTAALSESDAERAFYENENSTLSEKIKALELLCSVENIEKLVSERSAMVLAGLGTMQLESDKGGSYQVASTILEQFEKITDSTEKTTFWREHKKELLALRPQQ